MKFKNASTKPIKIDFVDGAWLTLESLSHEIDGAWLTLESLSHEIRS